MGVLGTGLRRELEGACVRGRRASETACRVALSALGVPTDRLPAHLNDGERVLRRGLRAKARQLGDTDGSIDLLVGECAYEQWHRLLFARFLAENELLIHPKFKVPVTLAECDELAAEVGEPDGWAVAGRFATEILPGIFRLDDPGVQLRLAPEGRLELEGIVEGLPADVFKADDGLGWVYQFWQRDKKDEVNASERKIEGADLGPVTQLFTENYMVRFLLENSLGAWWAARYPDSELVKDWDYLRFDDDGLPAAGVFDQWPERVADVTVMDPCCGSGHFLVEAFSMLWQMRVEEEGLSPVVAQDVVLRNNLFGLELDPRCVQIAMFAVALQAWKAGGGWRDLPIPNIACSGISVKAPVDEWQALTPVQGGARNALVRLHMLFRDAGTLGSLIDPKRAVEITDPTGHQTSFEDVNWGEVAPLLSEALAGEDYDLATAVLGTDAVGIARAADYLSRAYTLVVTNVPWLKRGSQSELLRSFCKKHFAIGQADLATSFLIRIFGLLDGDGTSAVVTPQNWLVLGSYKKIRQDLLSNTSWAIVARLGPGAFGAISGEVVQPLLMISSTRRPSSGNYWGLVADSSAGPKGKAADLFGKPMIPCSQGRDLQVPDSRVTVRREEEIVVGPLLGDFAESLVGMQTSDDNRFKFQFWEVPSSKWGTMWEVMQDVPTSNETYSGCSNLVRWELGAGPLGQLSVAWKGRNAWSRDGVIIARFGNFFASRYLGGKFHQNAAVILPEDSGSVAAVLSYCQSREYESAVRAIDTNPKITNATTVKVPFDIERWRRVVEDLYPEGLPEPNSFDPTQWLFKSRPEESTEPLQVAIGRLLGYRWPGQSEIDDLDDLADDDGIVCLPSVLGKPPANERLQELLALSFGVAWSPMRTIELLSASRSKKKDLESWLRDDFFKAHCNLFKNRPFVWHIWDGRKDGFAALVDYHRLDRSTLERLTFTYLGDWIERQTAAVRDDTAGAEERLAEAQDLQRRLELVLEGEPPYDIHVRWKSLAKQPIGWDPDLNDGVRLNVRPFVEAGVLRSKFNVKWGNDRGKNFDGSERRNDLHFTRAEKEAAHTRSSRE